MGPDLQKSMHKICNLNSRFSTFAAALTHGEFESKIGTRLHFCGTELAEALLFLQVPAGSDSVLNFNLWPVEGQRMFECTSPHYDTMLRSGLLCSFPAITEVNQAGIKRHHMVNFINLEPG